MKKKKKKKQGKSSIYFLNEALFGVMQIQTVISTDSGMTHLYILIFKNILLNVATLKHGIQSKLY